MWTAGSWLLHHDNIPAHAALSIRQFLAKHSIPTLPQHLYSPELSPPDFFLFPKLKITLKGRRFQTVEDITNVMNDLKAVPQTFFEQCFKKWKRQWENCFAAQGNYFEGDNIVTDLINALPGNSSVNTVQHTTVDEAVFSMFSVLSSGGTMGLCNLFLSNGSVNTFTRKR
jgi:hypothetical protein